MTKKERIAVLESKNYKLNSVLASMGAETYVPMGMGISLTIAKSYIAYSEIENINSKPELVKFIQSKLKLNN